MQAYLTLVRRELGSYFASITGYVIIAAVLLLLGFSFTEMITRLSTTPTTAPVTEMFYSALYFWLILLVTAPVITMRTFALEKFSGTYETLMTTPVSDAQVVAAKFAGALLFYLFTWLPLLACIFLVRHYTNDPTAFDPWTTASTFLGIFLIGCLYMALGCFASALTRSQLIAAINSFALGLALFLIGLRALSPVPAADWPSKVFAHISMIRHMEDFARGIVDTRHVAFYVSLTIFFLFLTLRVVESRRWK